MVVVPTFWREVKSLNRLDHFLAVGGELFSLTGEKEHLEERVPEKPEQENQHERFLKRRWGIEHC